MAKWLGRWACNLVVPGSSPSPCYSLDLFSVAPSSTPWLRFVNSRLVCRLLPVGIFSHFMFTVEPVYNGHPRDLSNWPLNTGGRLVQDH